MKKRSNGQNYTAIILLAVIAAGIIYLIIRNRKQLPAGTGDGMVRYKNSETRKIEWDYEHMVPTSITITRESKQMT
jgi:hypothetical protein